VTICTQDRELYFTNKNIAKLIHNYWCNLKNKFSNIDLDEYVIMPNHLHGILIINVNKTGDHKGRPYEKNYVGAGLVPARNQDKSTLGNIIGAFKSITTHKYIKKSE